MHVSGMSISISNEDVTRFGWGLRLERVQKGRYVHSRYTQLGSGERGGGSFRVKNTQKKDEKEEGKKKQSVLSPGKVATRRTTRETPGRIR